MSSDEMSSDEMRWIEMSGVNTPFLFLLLPGCVMHKVSQKKCHYWSLKHISNST